MDRRRKDKEKERKRASRQVQLQHAVDVHEESFHGLQANDVLDGELSIQIMDFVSQILKAQYPGTLGMFAPSFLYGLEMSRVGRGDIHIPKDRDAVQIHFVNNHYLVSTQRNGRLYVYDSLYNLQHLQSVHFQLELIYGQVNINTVTYTVPQSQGRTNLCGFFSISTAESLLRNAVPGSRFLDCSLMRTHLHQCLQNASIQQFPGYLLKCHKQNKMPSNQPTKLHNNEQYTTKRKSVDQVECDGLKAKRKSVDNVECNRFKAKIRQTECRKRRSVEQTSNDRLKDKLRRIEIRENRNVEQTTNDKELDKTRKTEYRSSRNLEQMNSYRMKDKTRKTEYRSSRNLEQMNSDRMKDKTRKTEYRSSRNVERTAYDKVNDKTKKKEFRRSRNVGQVNSDRVKAKTGMTEFRSKRNVEQMNSDKVKAKTGMTEFRSKRNVGQIKSDKVKAKTGMTGFRSKRNVEQMNSDKVKAKTGMTGFRSKRNVEQMNSDKVKAKTGMTGFRSKRNVEQMKSDKVKAKTGMTGFRSKRNVEQMKSDRVKDKTAKTNNRRSRNNDQIESDRVKDKTAKIINRRSRTVDEIESDRVKDKTAKTTNRINRTVQQRTRGRMKDTVRKGRERRRKSIEQVSSDKVKDLLRKKEKRHPQDTVSAIQAFKRNIQDAAEYVCTICHRLLYRNSVNRYVATSELTKRLSTHELSPDGQEYICTTCKRHLKKGKTPPQAQANKMAIPIVPLLLSELTDFEARLLARRYPFMKIVQLPKGKQRGILGRVVNVPVDAAELCTSLPRPLSASGILPVKLKRKRMYTGHVYYQNIRPDKIRQAFHWLLEHNSHYQNVVENLQWEDRCEEENAEVWKHFTEDNDFSQTDSCVGNVHSECDTIDSSDLNDDNDSDSDRDASYQPIDNNHEATEFDTCIQPADPTADACDILNIAPGEGKHPLHVMMDPNCEEQAFPQLFPTGLYGFNCERDIKLTPKKYFNARILNCKGHFAKIIEYLFFAQYVTEHKQVMDNVSVAVRKTFRALPSDSSLDAGFIKDPNRLKSLILKDKAYNFLQTVRGSPPYWQKIMFKLMAAVKQYGIFSLFVTLSSADMKWNDTLNAILRQQGRQLTDEDIEELTWEERCALLRSNPVTTARHFDHRLQCCFNDLLLGPAQVLGKVTHYSYRIEFQQRGSPHAHCVLWTEDAPGHKDDAKDIAQYVDKYISCAIPSEDSDPELYNLVTTVQKHHHTATCRKKGTTCRFHYPKLPSSCTIIAAPVDSDSEAEKAATVDTAYEILMDVMDALDNDKEDKITTIDELLTHCSITLEQYLYCLSITKTGRTVVLQREPDEMYINCYNKNLLRAWQANLDVQFCLDPYACIAYMVSYITKDEREMSAVLRNITREMAHHDWKEQLKSCANAFLNAREVSAQESVYRLLSMPLFKSNFSTVFVPADFPEKRVAFLKPMAAVMSMEDDEEDIYTTSIIDRYSARPNSLNRMCLAEFAVSYISDKKAAEGDSDQDDLEETTHDFIQLKNDLGRMRKRSKKSVLRYHRKSEAKQPDEYYYSQLMLFLPWISETTELLSLESYEQHYNDNKDTIEQNRSLLEHHADIICLAVEQFQELDPPTHAYDDVAAHTIQENDDLPQPQQDEDFALLHPDNTNTVAEPASTDFPVASASTTSVLEKRPDFCKEEDYYKHIRDLNDQQRDLFQSVFTWCTQKSLSHKTGTTPAQLCLYVSGGAGTGKSHLITALYQMALRAFQAEGETPDDVRVLLTAPTGTAAHNIGGVTLHSAFLLPLGQTKSCAALSDDKRNTIRSKTSNLELLIIDEISMVGTNLFLQLHYRLCEIKCSKQPFGGVTVLVFGDLYQLPPVKQKFIFEAVSDNIARLHGSLWEQFQISELTKIMRQKEDVLFAELLNRVRTASHTCDDVKILQTRQLIPPVEDYEALHVFPTNKEVDAHNNDHLEKLTQPVETIVAVDKKPSSLRDFKPSGDPRFTGGLPTEVQIAIGAKVMLTKNLDVSDGLVNGSQGKVVGFIKCGKGQDKKILAILIEFDSKRVGQNARQTSQFSLELHHFPLATPVLRAETYFTVARKNRDLKIIRYQFPVKLSWACTIHKVQGLTLDAVVVSFERQFANGQAYVALSRAKTIDRLYLSHFDEKKLKCSAKVNKEMEHLRTERKFSVYYEFLITWQNTVIISVLNTRSFMRHREDLLHDPVFNSSDLIVLSETWLDKRHLSEDIIPDTHTCFRADKPTNRSESRAGGVAVLVKLGAFSGCEYVSATAEKYIQTITVQLTSNSGETFNIIGVYNSPSNTTRDCERRLLSQTKNLDDLPSICSGDFNAKNPLGALQEIGFKQHVSSATHISGSCLDHLYTRSLPDVHTRVIPCYYSDHNWVTLSVVGIRK